MFEKLTDFVVSFCYFRSKTLAYYRMSKLRIRNAFVQAQDQAKNYNSRLLGMSKMLTLP
jgi:hypothetical protein